MKRLFCMIALLTLALTLSAYAETQEVRIGHVGLTASDDWSLSVTDGEHPSVAGFTGGGAFSLSAATDATLDFFSKEALCGKALALCASLTGGVTGEVAGVYRVADESLGFDYAHVSVTYPSDTSIAYAESAFCRFPDGEISQYTAFFSSEEGLSAIRALNRNVYYYSASKTALPGEEQVKIELSEPDFGIGSFGISERTLVTDTAKCLSPSALMSLNSLANQLSREAGADIGFAVLTGEPGEDILAVAEAYYAESDMGENGLLLVLHMSDSRWLMQSYGTVANRFTSEARDALAASFLSVLASGDFPAAMEIYLSGAADCVR